MIGSEPEPARGALAVQRARLAGRLSTLRGSDTAKAAGLAGAMIANNVIALGSTFAFSRLVNDYGALAALVSYLLILTVAGQAMQVATAREGVLGHLGVGEGLIRTVKRWSWSMLVVTAVLTVVSILLRDPIASLIGVKHFPWAAAVGLPAGCLYLQLSLLRGALQGIGDYRAVGISLIAEQATRLALGAGLAVAGLSVTGAFLGSLGSYVAISMYCGWQLRRRIPAPERDRRDIRDQLTGAAISLWTHVRRAWAPIAGLIVIAVLQNIDVIAAKHRFSKDVASSYAASAVAAKVLIWVAMGAGFYLVPEVSRRRSENEDTRAILLRALAIVGVCAVPVLAIYALGAHPLIQIAFGHKRTLATGSLLPLGAAFTALAGTYLAIQYLLALKRIAFLIVVGAVAAVEPVLLLGASRHPAGFATVVLAVQAVGAVVAFALAFRPDRTRPAEVQKRPSWEAESDPLTTSTASPETRPNALRAPTAARSSSPGSSSGS
jgi:O-antigen/teichoic acid export membrane protein